MILKNAVIFDENFDKVNADIKIENGKISEIGEINGENIVDCANCVIAPSFVDVHIHGCNGGDFSDGIDAMDKMSKYLITKGVTSFCGTTMTLSNEKLTEIMVNAKKYKGTESGAKLVGINLEGPFIAESKKGAQNGSYIRKGTIEEFDQLNAACGGIVKLIDIAPESFDSEEFIKKASKKASVSIAHTAADYEQTMAAFEQGANHVTHLFNAMTSMTHREPGVVGAALDCEKVMCEIICDGKHINPAVLRNVFKILGGDRAVVISDSLKASGLGEGVFDLGGQDVYVKDGYARLIDGTIAASISNIYEEFLNLLSFGIDEKAALKSCTINPAKSISEDDNIGSIKVGKDADLIIFDNEYNIKNVVLKGKIH